MDPQKFALHISGLSKIEALELAEIIGESNLQGVTDPDDGDRRFGDLVTTLTLVVIASSAIQGLAVWLAKRRVRAEGIENFSIEKLADGSMRVNMQRISRSGSSDTPSPAAIESRGKCASIGAQRSATSARPLTSVPSAQYLQAFGSSGSSPIIAMRGAPWR